jgi:hypothetical protein
LYSNLPLPFDHPLTIPILIVITSFSALAYFYMKAIHTAYLMETTRRRNINKRRQLERPEDRFASLKVTYNTDTCGYFLSLIGHNTHSSAWFVGRKTVRQSLRRVAGRRLLDNGSILVTSMERQWSTQNTRGT